MEFLIEQRLTTGLAAMILNVSFSLGSDDVLIRLPESGAKRRPDRPARSAGPPDRPTVRVRGAGPPDRPTARRDT